MALRKYDMDIKPTNLPPVLPGSNQALPTNDARADLESLQQVRPGGISAPETGATPERAIDPGEARLAADPWGQADGARMLTGPVSLSVSQAGEATSSAALPDAVRAAVDLVFQDPA